MKVSEYNHLINYKSGNTDHFEDLRDLREQELYRLLGVGKVIQRFLIEKEGEFEIQEILDNGIIKVYSCINHKKITTFAPGPNRFISLFEACGKVAPDNLIIQSEFNIQNGYNKILSDCVHEK